VRVLPHFEQVQIGEKSMFNLFRTKFYAERDLALQPHTLFSWFTCSNSIKFSRYVGERLAFLHRSQSLIKLRFISVKGQFINALAFIPHQIKDYGVGIPAELANQVR
jgi:hypothetical protein